MDHHGGVDPVERPGAGEEFLAGAVLLGGRAEQHGRAAGPLQDGDQREEGADGRGADDVVPAAVTDAGQRVVLGQHRHGRAAARTGRRPQRRG